MISPQYMEKLRYVAFRQAAMANIRTNLRGLAGRLNGGDSTDEQLVDLANRSALDAYEVDRGLVKRKDMIRVQGELVDVGKLRIKYCEEVWLASPIPKFFRRIFGE